MAAPAQLPTGVGLPATLLVIEDSPSDRRLIREMLVDSGADPDGVMCVGSLSEARRVLTANTPACILLDLSLPDAVGLEGVAVMASAAPEVPLVVVSGRPPDSLVYAAMAEGADEYLCKTDLDPIRINDVVIRAVQRRVGSESSRRNSVTASLVLDSIDAPTVALDGSGRIVAANGAWFDSCASSMVDRSAVGVGINYLTVCDQAAGLFAEGASESASGIRSVLFGEVDRFSVDYPCATDAGDRWFTMRVTPTGELGGGALVTHLDITHLKQAEQQLRRHEALLHSVFDETAPIFMLIGAEGIVQHVSEATTQLLGLHEHALVGSHGFSRADPGDSERALQAVRRVLDAPKRSERLEIRILDGSGRWRRLDIAIANLIDDPKVGAIAITGCDITQGHINQIARHLESRLLQRLPAGVIVTDDRGVIVYWNDRATSMYGYSVDDALGRQLSDLKIVPTGTEAEKAMVLGELSSGRWEGDYEATRADGNTLPVHTILEQIDDLQIGFRGVVGASTDISERRQLESDLAFQALHDSVTGLPNRRLFVEHLETALSRSNRNGKRTAVLFIDLDDFKLVNDRIGHLGGDHVLRMVGRVITDVLRGGDVAARLGGDEFVVCCDDLDGPEHALAVANRIVRALATPMGVEGAGPATTASIGLAVSGTSSRADGLLRNADIAMYAAKQAGKARVELFDDALHAQVRRKNDLAVQLERALDQGEIQTYFQPEVDLITGALVGFEALGRWHHPERGMVPPDEFIPIAEESGLVARLGNDVLEDSCRALRGWLDDDPTRALKVAVNVSARQLSDPTYPESVQRALEKARVPAEAVCLEVTESALIDADVAATSLWELKEAGVEIAIDDFGTGYSSLSRLHRFPLDYLKIDRSFVAGMSHRPEDAVIVSTVLSLARGLGIKTIAEGIEEESQLDELAASGCEFGQGWLWSPAVPLPEADAIVRSPGPLLFKKAAAAPASTPGPPVP